MLTTETTYYEEVAKGPEWQNAMIEEIHSIEKDQTLELVNFPKRKNVI